MSQETQRHEIARKRVVYQMPGMDGVTIQKKFSSRVTQNCYQVLTKDR